MLWMRASILADTSPTLSWSTWLAPAQFHGFHHLSLADPHTRVANRYNRQCSKDTLNRYIVQNRFPVQAHIRFEKQWNPTNLRLSTIINNITIIKIITIKAINKIIYKVTKMTIMTIIRMITVFRIVIYFQRRHKCTVKRFGPSIDLCCGREKEQRPCIPYSMMKSQSGETTKAPLYINTWRPNHKVVQSAAAARKIVLQGTGCKRAAHHCTWCGQAPNSCMCEMALALRWIC